MAESFAQIVTATENAFGAPVSHQKSVPVRLMTETTLDWEGTVEVFGIPLTQGTDICYSWIYIGPSGKTEYATVLGLEPAVDSPATAARVWLTALHQKHERVRQQSPN